MWIVKVIHIIAVICPTASTCQSDSFWHPYIYIQPMYGWLWYSTLLRVIILCFCQPSQCPVQVFAATIVSVSLPLTTVMVLETALMAVMSLTALVSSHTFNCKEHNYAWSPLDNFLMLLYADILAARRSGITVGSILGTLFLVTVFWCIAFCICLQVSTCPLHNVYYKRTIQNLAVAPPIQGQPQTQQTILWQ